MFARVFERCFNFFMCVFYNFFVLLRLAFGIVKLGPKAALGKKQRSKPPKCLEDPALGIHGYAHLEDIRMHYVSNGSEDKPLMLLVHGFPEFWYSWRFQLKEFHSKYRVVAVDLRGYGDTDKPAGVSNYTVPKLIGDLRQFVLALGYEKCVLVGHDWGGVLAWHFANKFPEMTSQLVILNAPNVYAFKNYLRSSRSQFKKSWYIFFFQAPWIPELMASFYDFASLDRMMLSKSMGIQSGQTTEEDVEAYKFNFSRNGFTCPINFYRANFGGDTNDGIEAYQVSSPTLIIWGENDGALERPLAKLSGELCTGSVSIKYIEGASHWVQMDRPDLVNKYMWEFLESK